MGGRRALGLVLWWILFRLSEVVVTVTGLLPLLLGLLIVPVEGGRSCLVAVEDSTV